MNNKRECMQFEMDKMFKEGKERKQHETVGIKMLKTKPVVLKKYFASQ